MAKEPRYTIRLGGEGGTSFAVEGWRGMTGEQAAKVLSFVTGYHADYITRNLDAAMERSGLKVWELRPAACSYGETPRFLIARD